MNELWQRAFGSMTRQADMSTVVTRSAVLTIAATISAVGYFHYLVFVVSGGVVPAVRDPWTFIGAELVLLALVLFLSALIGFSFSARFGLPGLGRTRDLVRSLPLLVVGGLGLVAISYFVFDRYFLMAGPVNFPKDPIYLATIPFKTALADETILRLGLVTIGVGLTKNKGAGVVLMSAVATLFTVKYLEFIGMPFALDYFYIDYLMLSFLGNIIVGWLFVTRGLLFAMVLKFVIGCKYLFILWVGA